MKEQKYFTKEHNEMVHQSILDSFKNHGKIIDHYFVDGYFIFDMGQSAVMHFKLDTAPNWKFGVWLSFVAAEKDYNAEKEDYIDYVVFAQNEFWIDKFKPSASEFVKEGKVYINSLNESQDYLKDIFRYIPNKFSLIFNEPYLAFYRHMHYRSFDEVYTTRREAKRFYRQFLRNERKTEKLNKKNLKKQFKFVKKFFKEKDLYYEVKDDGPSFSPRYEIDVILSKGSTEEEAKELYHEFFEEIKKFQSKLKGYYHGDYVSQFLNIYEGDENE